MIITRGFNRCVYRIYDTLKIVAESDCFHFTSLCIKRSSQGPFQSLWSSFQLLLVQPSLPPVPPEKIIKCKCIFIYVIELFKIQYRYLILNQTAPSPSSGRVKQSLGIKTMNFIPSDYFTLPGLGLGAVWFKTRYRYCIYRVSQKKGVLKT